MTEQLWAFFAIGLAILLLSLGMWRRGKAGKDAGGDGGGVWFGGDSSGGDCGGGDGGGGGD